jgi:hypothetical protein
MAYRTADESSQRMTYTKVPIWTIPPVVVRMAAQSVVADGL